MVVVGADFIFIETIMVQNGLDPEAFTARSDNVYLVAPTSLVMDQVCVEGFFDNAIQPPDEGTAATRCLTIGRFGGLMRLSTQPKWYLRCLKHSISLVSTEW